MNIAYNRDCMEAMKEYPDKFFDLAVVDPPYGGGSDADAKNVFKGSSGRFGGKFVKYCYQNEPLIEATRTGRTCAEKDKTKIRHWDIAPPPAYFEELVRISKNQIIWGGNYFDLPPTRCFLVWRKINIPLEGFSMAPCEYAWTSFNANAGMFETHSHTSANSEARFHPTQKPVSLYKWILSKYAKEGDKILDTHLGSGSSRIAAYDLGFDFTGFEIDEYYFSKQEERYQNHTSQLSLFTEVEG